MKRTVLMAMPLAVLLLVSTGKGALGAVETSGSLSYVSKYIWRGWDLAPSNEPAVQGGVSVAWPSGMAFDVWGSYALDGDPQIDELDYTLSYTGNISTRAEFSVGYTHYTFPSTVSAAEAQTESSEAFIGVAWPKAFLSPSLTVYHDWEAGDGTYYFLGGSTEFTLADDESTPPLALSLGVGYNDTQWGAESGVSDIGIGLSMTFKSGSVDITPSINYVVTPEDTVNPDNEFWFGVGFGFSL